MESAKYNPAKRNINLGLKEGKRFKYLGNMGESIAEQVLKDNGFHNIRNVNTDKNNFHFADLYAEKGTRKYLISVKTRNKFEYSGKLNSRYKFGKNLIRKVEKALEPPEFKDCEPAWLSIAMEEKTFDAYFGLISELNGRNGINMSSKACATYQCFAKNRPHDFNSGDFKNIYDLRLL